LERSKSSAKKKKKSVLRKLIDFFVKSEHHAYLVGGYVRDSTLGRESVDIDVVVEGDAVKIARKLNAKLKGKLSGHSEFRTATISINDHRVDLASARTEKYPSPAHLPHVYPSTIVEDLNRRDFTINAIAMSVSKENFGEIFDPFEGLSDIKKKSIRILHKNSFVDDPTRIFRALRYKNRFGFKLEEETERLMREAVKGGMIDRLSGQRILNELRLIFAEDAFQQTALDIAHYGVLPVKRAELQILPPSKEHAFYFFVSKIEKNRLPLTKEEQKVTADFRRIREVIAQLQKAQKRSKVYAILSPVARETLQAITSIKPDLRSKIDMFERMRKIRPLLSGIDLRKHGIKPGRQYTNLLHRVFNMQLDREIRNRKQALQYLRTLKK
jgi:tRNA nucleotidyltransferase (CCA-adding enzyme)